VPQPALLFS